MSQHEHFVKVIAGTSINVERDTNSWLKENHNKIVVHDFHTSSCAWTAPDGSGLHTITIVIHYTPDYGHGR